MGHDEVQDLLLTAEAANCGTLSELMHQLCACMCVRACWLARELPLSPPTHPLLAALGGGQLRRHALLHLPAVGHDGLQDGDGAGPQGPPLLVPPGDSALKIPLESQERVGEAVVAVALLEKHLLPLGLEVVGGGDRGETGLLALLSFAMNGNSVTLRSTFCFSSIRPESSRTDRRRSLQRLHGPHMQFKVKMRQNHQRCYITPMFLSQQGVCSISIPAQSPSPLTAIRIGSGPPSPLGPDHHEPACPTPHTHTAQLRSGFTDRLRWNEKKRKEKKQNNKNFHSNPKTPNQKSLQPTQSLPTQNRPTELAAVKNKTLSNTCDRKTFLGGAAAASNVYRFSSG